MRVKACDVFAKEERRVEQEERQRAHTLYRDRDKTGQDRTRLYYSRGAPGQQFGNGGVTLALKTRAEIFIKKTTVYFDDLITNMITNAQH